MLTTGERPWRKVPRIAGVCLDNMRRQRGDRETKKKGLDNAMRPHKDRMNSWEMLF